MNFFSSTYSWTIPLIAAIFGVSVNIVIRFWHNRRLYVSKSEESKILETKDKVLEIEDWVANLRKQSWAGKKNGWIIAQKITLFFSIFFIAATIILGIIYIVNNSKDDGIDAGPVIQEKIVIADAGDTIKTEVDKEIAFDASASTITPDDGKTTINYSWDWDGDGTYDETVDTAIAKHTFSETGIYKVGLKVSAFEDIEDTDIITVTIIAIEEPNKVPLADAGGPYTVTSGEELIFDGSESLDLDGEIIEYSWDFGDGSTGTGETPAHVYSGSGKYSAKLTVKDNTGEVSEEAVSEITVSDASIEPPNGGGEEAPEDIIMSFENGKQGWDIYDRANYSKSFPVATSSDYSFDGSKSLKIEGITTGYIAGNDEYYAIFLNLNNTAYGRDIKTISVKIYIPSNGNQNIFYGRLRVYREIMDEDNIKQFPTPEAGGIIEIIPGNWTTISVNLAPVGESYSIFYENWRINVWSNSPYEGPVYFDYVYVDR